MKKSIWAAVIGTIITVATTLTIWVWCFTDVIPRLKAKFGKKPKRIEDLVDKKDKNMKVSYD